jgi:hypothetical protein
MRTADVFRMALLDIACISVRTLLGKASISVLITIGNASISVLTKLALLPED